MRDHELCFEPVTANVVCVQLCVCSCAYPQLYTSDTERKVSHATTELPVANQRVPSTFLFPHKLGCCVCTLHLDACVCTCLYGSERTPPMLRPAGRTRSHETDETALIGLTTGLVASGMHQDHN